MKVSLNVDYRTNWGETLYVTGSPKALGADKEEAAVPMTLEGNQRWVLEFETPKNNRRISYRYFVKSDKGVTRREWGPAHTLFADTDVDSVVVYDRWQDRPMDQPYYASAFVDCICAHPDRQSPTLLKEGMLNLRVSAPMLAPGESIAILGNCDSLGNWNTDKPVRLSNSSFPEWNLTLPVESLVFPLDYKFVIIDTATGRVKAWEGGDNRHINIKPEVGAGQAVVMSGMRFINPLAPWRGAGVAIPVFSLRSNEDFGVGDFYDLFKMVDWAVKTGQRFIQILPINDTTMTHTWTDSYPYNANSTFALHPMYLRVEAVGKLADADRQHYYENLKRELNLNPTVDYERVNKAKHDYVAEIFAMDGEETLGSADFKKFFDRNEKWLKPYAAFCVLRDTHGTPVFQEWGEYAVYDPQKVDAFIADNKKAIGLIYFEQYHLDHQLRQVSDYARSRGVALKGDIPIGISRTSADAWITPRLFNLGCQAGAPPDDFSVLGQNWGFPTYNWNEMSRDGYGWWKARFEKMAEYFDAYRIDHVLGFFRIWEIPISAVHGLLGVFNPALPFTPDELRKNYDFWIEPDLHAQPYIAEYMLSDFFGEYADEARAFLTPIGDGRYSLKSEFDTQRKIVDHFAGLDKNDRNDRLCEGLLGLADQVLFIEDPTEKGKYHPRISAQFTYIYRALNDYERWCFDRLYNDFFYHRHNDFWYKAAMEKLPPLINATKMLVCAEDLGMIPSCVPAVLNRLQILTLEIQRMPKDPATPFGVTWNYPYRSVCTTSTHDMDGIRQWWQTDREVTQRFYNEVLHCQGEAPFYAETWICEKIVDLHLKSPSMLCILPLQDWLSIDGVLRRQDPREELINIPANPRHYWRYRMHLTLEQLLDADDFNGKMLSMINQTGR